MKISQSISAGSLTKSKKRKGQKSVQLSGQDVARRSSTQKEIKFSDKQMVVALKVLLMESVAGRPSGDAWQLALYAAKDDLVKMGLAEDLAVELMNDIVKTMNVGMENHNWPKGFF